MSTEPPTPLGPRDRGFVRLGAALDDALRALPQDGPLAVLFSGGVDSGLLAWELRRRPSLRLSVFGLANSADRHEAPRGAEALGCPLVSSSATPEEVREMARRVDDWAPGLTRTERSVETAFALAVERAPAGPVVCGQGADELFFGYAHYRGCPAPEAFGRSEQDLARVLATAWPRAREIARQLGREVLAPYLDLGFVSAALSIPAEARWRAPPAKAYWRAFAAHRGLPGALADRPKRALQYGSGVDRHLRPRPAK